MKIIHEVDVDQINMGYRDILEVTANARIGKNKNEFPITLGNYYARKNKGIKHITVVIPDSEEAIVVFDQKLEQIDSNINARVYRYYAKNWLQRLFTK